MARLGICLFLIRLCLLCCMHIESIEPSLKYWVPRTHDMILGGGGALSGEDATSTKYPLDGHPYLSNLDWRCFTAWGDRTLLQGRETCGTGTTSIACIIRILD